MFKRVAIVGPGLIGGSFGLAIKARKCAAHVVGCRAGDVARATGCAAYRPLPGDRPAGALRAFGAHHAARGARRSFAGASDPRLNVP